MDALYLFESFSDGQFKAIGEVIQDHEEKMFDYASKIQKEMAEAEAGIHSDDDITDIIKDRK